MKAQTEQLEHASVRQYCKLVRVPAIANSFVSLAEQAVKRTRVTSGTWKLCSRWKAKSETAMRSTTGLATRNCRV